jgi:mono/diheme cytochrome c family protein
MERCDVDRWNVRERTRRATAMSARVAVGLGAVLLWLAACSQGTSPSPVEIIPMPVAVAAGSTTGALPQSAQQGDPPALSDAALIETGRALYAGNCAPCHQINGEGNLSIFPALNRNAFVTVRDPTGVIETVLHGRQLMPAFEATLSPQEIAAVLSYIRNAWDNQAPVVYAEQVSEVQGGARTE